MARRVQSRASRTSAATGFVITSSAPAASARSCASRSLRAVSTSSGKCLRAAAREPDEEVAAELEAAAYRASERSGFAAAASAYERAAAVFAATRGDGVIQLRHRG